jgi:Rieske Fe-S protein
MADDPDRRRFLKVATCAFGGGVGLAIVGPALRLVLDPAGQKTVTTPTEPFDLGPANRVAVGAGWQRVQVIAPVVSDAWTTAHDVAIGAAFVRRPEPAKVEALSATCPHFGCPVSYETAAKTFLCPCHNSRWNDDGERLPDVAAKRGLDPLAIEIRDGRLRLTWVAYKLDIADREKV